MDRGTYPTDQAEVLAQLTGHPAVAHPVDTSPGNEPAVERWLRDRLDASSPVLVGTNTGDDEGKLPCGLAPAHAYEVVAVRDSRITLHNPWKMQHPAPLTVREFLDSIVPFVSALKDKKESL